MTRDELATAYETLNKMFLWYGDQGEGGSDDEAAVVEGMRQVEIMIFRLGFAPIDHG